MNGRTPGHRDGELPRRHVLRIAAPYAAFAIIILVGVFAILAMRSSADGSMTSAIALAIVGFPVALILAWRRARTSARAKRLTRRPSRDMWNRLHDIFNAALDEPAAARSAFVANACAGDSALRGEVLSLLAAHTREGVLDRAAPDLADVATDFPAPGATVGRYEILDTLGNGGMGVVYKARDLRLERVVALKFLPPHLGADAHARDRFLVEAQAAAALDHPNICTIHEIGESDEGHVFLAMPFYDGETLKQRLASGPLPIAQAIDIAIQVAQGLATAHDRGIVHRDIKPANLVVTMEGMVKIVDFGIAKLTDITLTGPGMTPGTVAYMSPEQAGGEEVDSRTDLWSLGVVLYEMLTGERPFTGADGSLIRGRRSDVSVALEQVVGRSLGRAREERYQTARDMVHALEKLRAFGADALADTAVRTDGSAGSSTASNGTSTSSVPIEGERRQATIVSSTIAGYAGLVGSLVPEEMERLGGRIREVAAEVAARHGGTLNRCDEDRIVMLFGIPTTHEDDGVRAVRSALELHTLVRALSHGVEGQNGQTTVRLHTGIDTGRVIVRASPDGDAEGGYRIAGTAAQVAAQLGAHAGVDEVWASPECQRVIGPFFETEPRKALAVRGRAQPLIPFRVLGESGVRTRLEAAEKAGLTAYAGRESELSTLEHARADALRGEGRLVTITGDAGIGKSRLLHEFQATLDRDRVSCVLGRCQPDGGTVPYLPFTEILRTALRIADAAPGGVLERTVERIREIGPELEEFIPLYLHLLSIPGKTFRSSSHLQGDALRLAIEEALAALLTLCARRHPLVVLLEDWHWADEASRSALRQVAEVVAGYPLLLVVTCRSGYGMDWSTASRHTPVPLRPLDPGSLGKLLESLLGVQSLPAELAALLHQRTGGNPFFLEEMCMALLEQGAIRIVAGEARPAGPLQLLELPDSVEAVIRARLDRLDANARDVLRVAAVVGRDFSRAVLERTVADAARLPEAIDTLKSAGVVRQTQIVPDVMYRFHHVLTQEVAYASLLEHQLRDLHGRVGAAIELLGLDRIDDHLDRLAHHFSRAEEWRKAIEYGVRSAERAGALGQYAEALQILERTQRWLIHLPDGADRQGALREILLRQERLCETLGQRARQQEIINELILMLEPDGDRATLAEVYLRLGDVCTLLRRYPGGEDALQRSLRIRRELADQAGERKALRSLGLLRWFQGRNQEALAYASDVVVMDRECDDLVALVGDLTSLSSVLKALDQRVQAKACLEEGYDIAEAAIAAGSIATSYLRVKQAYVLNGLAVLCREDGDLDSAVEYVARAWRIAEVRWLPIYLPYHHSIAAHVLLAQGRIEESLDRYHTAVEQARRVRHIPGLSQTLRIRGEVLLSLNRYAEARPCLEEAAGLFAQLEDHEAEASMWTGVGTACDGENEHASAIAAWTRSRELWKQWGSPARELEALEGLGAATRRLIPESSEALACYREAVELACALEDRPAEGRLRNTLGILEWNRGEYAQALPHYERALAIFSDLQDTAHAGLMANSVALTLRQLGQCAEARHRFEDALTIHRETGQQQLEGHALAALGDISSELGETAQAVEYYERSLAIRRGTGDRRGEGWMLYSLACNDDPDRAHARVEGAAEIARGCGDHELAGACEEWLRTSGSQSLPGRGHAPIHHRAERRSADPRGDLRRRPEIQ